MFPEPPLGKATPAARCPAARLDLDRISDDEVTRTVSRSVVQVKGRPVPPCEFEQAGSRRLHGCLGDQSGRGFASEGESCDPVPSSSLGDEAAFGVGMKGIAE